MKKIPEIIKLTARKLRKNQTVSESLIWEKVKDRKIGVKIQRQYPLYIFTEDSGLYRFIIPDFYCSEYKLIIEIDGNIHDKQDIYILDSYKEELLMSQGYSILRFKANDILSDSNKIISQILSFLEHLQPLSLEKRENSRVSFKKRFIMKNEHFVCENCNFEVSKHPSGSARNHCPNCLYSKHLDAEFPGDRASDCYGLMKVIGLDHRKNKGLMLVHECTICGKKMLNRVAEDDNQEILRVL